MQRGHELEEDIYKPEHIELVLKEIETAFPKYFSGFHESPNQLQFLFAKVITEYESEQERYRKYMNIKALSEFEDDPASLNVKQKQNAQSSIDV